MHNKVNQTIYSNSSIKKALNVLENNEFDSLIILDITEKVAGIFTYGDFQRLVLGGIDLNLEISKVMNKDFVFLNKKDLSTNNIIKIFKKNNIDIIPVLENSYLLNILYRRDYKSKIKTDMSAIKITSVIIMAGGVGKRLDPFTRILPKPLIPVGDKTILELIISKFYKDNLKDITISLNYKSNLVKLYNKEYLPNYKFKYIDEDKFLGTLGSVKFSKSKKKYLFISNCDIIADINYCELLNFHVKNNNDITLLVSMQNLKIPYGVCSLDKKGMLIQIDEKPTHEYLVNTGIYIINSELRSLIPKNTIFSINDLVFEAKKIKKKIAVMPILGSQWMDIGEWSKFDDTYKKIN